MKTWFEFNGINSTDMGVILSVTPPTVKPQQRYTNDMYDCIDGSQVEELGYSSYIKEINIGIKDYGNVQKIASWLKGKGKLVIWNEPTMYYDVQILEQIDYTKLRKFGTAKITCLTQPYKKLIREKSITGNDITINNPGNEKSLPKITLKAKGTVKEKINDVEICTISLGDTETTIILDSETQDAYNTDGTLANRKLNGTFAELIPGKNKISFSDGTITSVETEVNARWV